MVGECPESCKTQALLMVEGPFMQSRCCKPTVGEGETRNGHVVLPMNLERAVAEYINVQPLICKEVSHKS